MVEDRVRQQLRERLRWKYRKEGKRLGRDYMDVKIDGLFYDEALTQEYERHAWKTGMREGEERFERSTATLRTNLLYLRGDQASELVDTCVWRMKNAETKRLQLTRLKELLAVRYFLFNGLSPMELSNARIEHMDPVERTLFLPRRHWKKNCVTHIDAETVRLQIIYSGNRKKGPLLRSKRIGHFSRLGLNVLVHRVAMHTDIAGKEHISPLVLKRTFGRLWIKKGGTVGGLKEQFGHRHLWSTEHYARFDLRDMKEEHNRMMQKIEGQKAESVGTVAPATRVVNPFVERIDRLDRRAEWMQKKPRSKRRHSQPTSVYEPF